MRKFLIGILLIIALAFTALGIGFLLLSEDVYGGLTSISSRKQLPKESAELGSLLVETEWRYQKEELRIGDIPLLSFSGGFDDAVLFVHDLGASKERMAEYMPVFLERGFDVYALDLPGHGGRGGKNGYGVKEKDDLIRIARVLEKDHLFLYGKGYGAMAAVTAAARAPGLFSGLILECPAVSGEKMIRKELLVTEDYTGIPADLLRAAGAVGLYMEDRLRFQDFEMKSYMKEVQAPLLLYYSDRGEVPVTDTLVLYDRKDGNKKLCPSDVSCGDFLRYDRENYLKALDDFLQDLQ